MFLIFYIGQIQGPVLEYTIIQGVFEKLADWCEGLSSLRQQMLLHLVCVDRISFLIIYLVGVRFYLVFEISVEFLFCVFCLINTSNHYKCLLKSNEELC